MIRKYFARALAVASALMLTAAGGAVLDPGGAPLRYAKAEEGYRTGPFVAWGRAP